MPGPRHRKPRPPTIIPREVSATSSADCQPPEAVFAGAAGGGLRREVIVRVCGRTLLAQIVLICRCPAGAFFAANLSARAAAGGCSSCNINLLMPGNPRDVIDALARKGRVRVVSDGVTAANDLGHTDAVPAHRRAHRCTAAVHHPRQRDPRLSGRRSQPPLLAGPSRHSIGTGAPLVARYASVDDGSLRKHLGPILRPQSWTGHSGRLAHRPVGAAGVSAGDRAQPAPAGEGWSTPAGRESEALQTRLAPTPIIKKARGSSSR